MGLEQLIAGSGGPVPVLPGGEKAAGPWELLWRAGEASIVALTHHDGATSSPCLAPLLCSSSFPS